MSSLVVETCRISEVRAHPNAEKLEICVVKGWQTITTLGSYKKDDLVVYVPPDSVLPLELSEKLGVTKYLSSGRVRCAKLRGEPSFGFIFKPDGDIPVGTDMAEKLGITKYIPPVKIKCEDAEPEDERFAKYTDIENMRHYPDVIRDGEEVVITEKIHGSSSRTGAIRGEDGWSQIVAGSHRVRRKRPADIAGSIYWSPLNNPGIESMLKQKGMNHKQVIIFGEIYGKVQSLNYGIKNLAYRAFDIMVDGKYLDYDDFRAMCECWSIPMVPVLYRGAFSLAVAKELAEGKTTIPGADHIREGVVVRLAKERHDPKVGRVILKYVGDGYLFGEQSDTNDE